MPFMKLNGNYYNTSRIKTIQPIQGGQVTSIWLVDVAQPEVVKIPTDEVIGALVAAGENVGIPEEVVTEAIPE